MSKLSLETSKLLKEVGFPQETKFCFFKQNTNEGDYYALGVRIGNRIYESYTKAFDEQFHIKDDCTIIACPSSDEILELLPLGTDITKKYDGWDISCHCWSSTKSKWFDDISLPEALAQMYIFKTGEVNDSR